MRARVNQSVGIMQVFVSLGAGAVIVWLVQRLAPAQRQYVATSKAMENSLFASSTEWFQVLLTNLPIIFLGIVGMGGIAFAVFQSSFR
jgi:hypothetical protein